MAELDKFVFIVHALSPIHRWLMGLRGGRIGIVFGGKGDSPSDIHNICQFQYGDEFRGDVIGIPMTPELFLADQERALNFMIKSVLLSAKDGKMPSAIGLGSLCAVVAGRGESLQRHFDSPVTTGQAATTWCLYRNVLDALSTDDPQSPVAIVGASSPVGMTLCKMLDADGVSLVVDSKKAGRKTSARVVSSSEIAASQSRLIVGCATAGPVLDAAALIENTRLIDISLPSTLRGRPHSSVTILTGETMSIPEIWHRGFWGPIYHVVSGYGLNNILACLIEPLVLLSCNRSQPFAQGREIKPSDVLEFGKVASDMGFFVKPCRVKH